MQIRFSTLFSCLAAIPLAALLSGCALTNTASPTAATGAAITGNVHGGQQPVAGAHVYLMAASTTGYGQPSTSLLLGSSTGFSDSVGGYVKTAADGSFSITGDYSCTAGSQVYLLALGGNPGAGVNSAAGFMSVLGQCPAAGTFAASIPNIWVSEVSTVAAAYAMAGFATDSTHVSSSSTALAQSGLAIAFSNAANLVGINTGAALAATPIGNGIVPQATINSIANILASCVNSVGPTSLPCATLFADATDSNGNLPTETASAAINIAHNPGANVAALFNLAAPAAAFSPALTSAPNDFTIGVTFSGTGANGAGINGPVSVAVDGFGDIWLVNANNSTVSKLSGNGAPQSPATGFTSGNLFLPLGIAIDGNENAWVAQFVNNLTEYSTTGAIAPGSPYTGGGLAGAQGISIYGSSEVWTPNINNNSVSEFTGAGVAVSPASGFTANGTIQVPVAVTVDTKGNAWVANQGNSGNGFVTVLSPTGSVLSGVNGYTGGGINSPSALASDRYGNVFVTNYVGNSISEFNNGGNVMSPPNGYLGGGLSSPYGLVLDGATNVWTANFGNHSVSKFTSYGAAVSPALGFAPNYLFGPQSVAVDGAGSLWVANSNAASVTQLVGLAVPTVTPVSTALVNQTVGTRP